VNGSLDTPTVGAGIAILLSPSLGTQALSFAKSIMHETNSDFHYFFLHLQMCVCQHSGQRTADSPALADAMFTGRIGTL
jgi:hypothetical protein